MSCSPGTGRFAPETNDQNKDMRTARGRQRTALTLATLGLGGLVSAQEKGGQLMEEGLALVADECPLNTALPEGAEVPPVPPITDDGLEDDLLDTRQLVIALLAEQEERFTVSIVNEAGELLREVDVVAGPGRHALPVDLGMLTKGRYAALISGASGGSVVRFRRD